MQVQKISNNSNNNYNPSFKKLDTKFLIFEKGVKLVKKERPALEELAKNYDIKLASEYNAIYNAEYITVKVRDLGKRLNIWQWLCGRGETSANVEKCPSVLELVEDAIEDLHPKKPTKKEKREFVF